MKRRKEILVLFIAFFIVNNICEGNDKVQYDGKVVNVPISDDSTIDLISHWTDQAYSGLFAAVAAKKFHEVSSEAQNRLSKCSKESKNAYEHAACVSDLLKHREKYGIYKNSETKPNFNSALRKSASGFLNIDGINSATTSIHEKSQEIPSVNPNPPISIAFQQEEEPKNVQIQGSFIVASDSEESYSPHRGKRELSSDFEKKSIVSRPEYEIKNQNQGLSPLGAIAKVLLKSVLIKKNKKKTSSWQSTIQRIRFANKERKKLEEEKKIKKTKLPFDPESKIDALEKFAYRAIGEAQDQFGNLDPENPQNLKKLAKDNRLRDSSDPLRKFLNLLRNGIKLGYDIAGKNTTDFDDKTLKVVSPRFLSVVPEENSEDIIDVISPSLFSLHNEGKGIENLTSLPNLVKSFNGADQQQWLDLIIEAAGVEEQAEKLEKELEERKSGIKKNYQEKVRGADGQPMFFTKENVTQMYGNHEGNKIETFEKLIKSYSMEQLKQMNETGFAVLTKDQIYMMYGPESPFNNSEVLEKLMKVHPDEAMKLIEKDIHLMGEMGQQKRKKRDIVLSPIVEFPIIFAAPLLNQFVVLSPLVFSPIVGTPAVLGPIILSPWVFIPLILSPRVLGPLILSPMIFSPIVLSPLVLHPLILTPGIFNPVVLSPLVLSPLILSPQVFTPIILSPLVLNPLILNPMVGSPLVLSPFVLSPLILSPQALFAVVLSPYALSPLVLSPLAAAEVILSPSWLS